MATIVAKDLFVEREGTEGAVYIDLKGRDTHVALEAMGQSLFFTDPFTGEPISENDGAGVVVVSDEPCKLILDAQDASCFQLVDVDDTSIVHVSYRILDPVTRLVSSVHKERFELVVTEYGLQDANNDGIFEPGEDAILSFLNLYNASGMDIPAGAVFRLLGEEVTLPAVDAASKLTIHPNIAIPLPCMQEKSIASQPFEEHVTFSPTLTLHGRLFRTRTSMESSLALRFPVSITAMNTPSHMEQFKTYSVSLTLNNDSHDAYGTNGTLGNVSINLSCSNPCLVFINGEREVTSIDLELLAPGSSTCSIQARLTEDAESFISTSIEVKAELVLRGNSIQNAGGSSRIVPTYVHGVTSDVLFVTSKDMTSASINAWKTLFRLLGLSYNYWDASFHGGFTDDIGHEPWQSKCKYLVLGSYPACAAYLKPSTVHEFLHPKHKQPGTDAISLNSIVAIGVSSDTWSARYRSESDAIEGAVHKVRYPCKVYLADVDLQEQEGTQFDDSAAFKATLALVSAMTLESRLSLLNTNRDVMRLHVYRINGKKKYTLVDIVYFSMLDTMKNEPSAPSRAASYVSHDTRVLSNTILAAILSASFIEYLKFIHLPLNRPAKRKERLLRRTNVRNCLRLLEYHREDIDDLAASYIKAHPRGMDPTTQPGRPRAYSHGLSQ